jgi:D-sedoheptulose 7-phosphate isomerase
MEQERSLAELAADLNALTLESHRRAFAALDDTHLQAIVTLAQAVADAWSTGSKLMICGNGGSAADAQHIAAELVGRFEMERPAYAAMALTVNTSTMTAVGNDYGFDEIFARQVTGLGRPNDVLLVISTSGNSRNCELAVAAARDIGMSVQGFLGKGGGVLLAQVDNALVAPSNDTPRIQEIHITMGHLLCAILEQYQSGK